MSVFDLKLQALWTKSEPMVLGAVTVFFLMVASLLQLGFIHLGSDTINVQAKDKLSQASLSDLNQSTFS